MTLSGRVADYHLKIGVDQVTDPDARNTVFKEAAQYGITHAQIDAALLEFQVWRGSD